jgi:serine/threonine-protein kinase
VDVCPQAGIQLQDIHKLSGLVVDDRYRLRDALGVGGMGTVYEAVHMLIDRALAIKFLEPALARQRESLERFYNEARVFSTVGHPNLVEVTDMGITPEGLPYMVMEKLEGIDLARLMFTRKVLPTIAAVTLAIEVLRTLEAVHAKGIVHRDLKPENVFLSGDPGEETLKILDFGISRLIPRSGEDRRLTQKGIVFGTPQYMSPEQAWGRDEIDHRSDLFTVGEILYEMITGRPVFEGDNNLAVLSAVTRAEIASPRRIRPSIPEALDRIVMTALSKEPADRFADAGRFADALEELAREDERWAPGRILDLGEEGPAPAPARDGRSRTDPGIPPAPKPG